MNVTRTNGSKVLATLLVACLPVLLMPSTRAGATSSITGTVFSVTPTNTLTGVVVHVANIDDQRIFSSVPTSADGSYIVEDLPAGSYEIAIESAGVLYTVGVPIQLGAGHTRQLQLNLDGQVDARQGVPTSELRGVWSNPLVATLIVVGSVVAIGLIADSSSSGDPDEGPSSPF